MCDAEVSNFQIKPSQLIGKNEENLQTISDIPENRSNLSTQTKSIDKNYERILKKNLSLGSFKSGHSMTRMDPID